MAEVRPRLVAVGGPAERAGRAGERALPPRRRLVVPLLAAALVLCALGWGLARRDANALSRELAATQGALAEASLRLEALESQRAQVRTQVQALAADAAAFAGRLGELEALVAADLEPAARTEAQDRPEGRVPRSEPRAGEGAGEAQATGNEGEPAD
jgi:hypothetical protein